jgi:hypothetical protein
MHAFIQRIDVQLQTFGFQLPIVELVKCAVSELVRGLTRILKPEYPFSYENRPLTDFMYNHVTGSLLR